MASSSLHYQGSPLDTNGGYVSFEAREDAFVLSRPEEECEGGPHTKIDNLESNINNVGDKGPRNNTNHTTSLIKRETDCTTDSFVYTEEDLSLLRCGPAIVRVVGNISASGGGGGGYDEGSGGDVNNNSSSGQGAGTGVGGAGASSTRSSGVLQRRQHNPYAAPTVGKESNPNNNVSNASHTSRSHSRAEFPPPLNHEMGSSVTAARNFHFVRAGPSASGSFTSLGGGGEGGGPKAFANRLPSSHPLSPIHQSPHNSITVAPLKRESVVSSGGSGGNAFPRQDSHRHHLLHHPHHSAGQHNTSGNSNSCSQHSPYAMAQQHPYHHHQTHSSKSHQSHTNTSGLVHHSHHPNGGGGDDAFSINLLSAHDASPLTEDFDIGVMRAAAIESSSQPEECYFYHYAAADSSSSNGGGGAHYTNHQRTNRQQGHRQNSHLHLGASTDSGIFDKASGVEYRPTTTTTTTTTTITGRTADALLIDPQYLPPLLGEEDEHNVRTSAALLPKDPSGQDYGGYVVGGDEAEGKACGQGVFGNVYFVGSLYPTRAHEGLEGPHVKHNSTTNSISDGNTNNTRQKEHFYSYAAAPLPPPLPQEEERGLGRLPFHPPSLPTPPMPMPRYDDGTPMPTDDFPHHIKTADNYHAHQPHHHQHHQDVRTHTGYAAYEREGLPPTLSSSHAQPVAAAPPTSTCISSPLAVREKVHTVEERPQQQGYVSQPFLMRAPHTNTNTNNGDVTKRDDGQEGKGMVGNNYRHQQAVPAHQDAMAPAHQPTTTTTTNKSNQHTVSPAVDAIHSGSSPTVPPLTKLVGVGGGRGGVRGVGGSVSGTAALIQANPLAATETTVPISTTPKQLAEVLAAAFALQTGRTDFNIEVFLAKSKSKEDDYDDDDEVEGSTSGSLHHNNEGGGGGGGTNMNNGYECDESGNTDGASYRGGESGTCRRGARAHQRQLKIEGQDGAARRDLVSEENGKRNKKVSPLDVDGQIEEEEGTEDGDATEQSSPTSTGPSIEVCCPSGWQFSLFDSEIRQHYYVDSRKVFITAGAVKYVEYFNRFGHQTRFRFQLCRRFRAGRCKAGYECQYLHTRELPRATNVHVNENAATSNPATAVTAQMIAGGINNLQYPTLPAGVVLSVFPPNNASTSSQIIASHQILKTAGASAVFSVLAQQQGVPASGSTAPLPMKQRVVSIPRGREHYHHRHHHSPQANNTKTNSCGEGGPVVVSTPSTPPPSPNGLKPRHCAHFQFKRMCHLGFDCNFIHSLVPYIQGVTYSYGNTINNNNNNSNIINRYAANALIANSNNPSYFTNNSNAQGRLTHSSSQFKGEDQRRRRGGRGDSPRTTYPSSASAPSPLSPHLFMPSPSPSPSPAVASYGLCHVPMPTADLPRGDVTNSSGLLLDATAGATRGGGALVNYPYSSSRGSDLSIGIPIVHMGPPPPLSPPPPRASANIGMLSSYQPSLAPYQQRNSNGGPSAGVPTRHQQNNNNNNGPMYYDPNTYRHHHESDGHHHHHHRHHPPTVTHIPPHSQEGGGGGVGVGSALHDVDPFLSSLPFSTGARLPDNGKAASTQTHTNNTTRQGPPFEALSGKHNGDSQRSIANTNYSGYNGNRQGQPQMGYPHNSLPQHTYSSVSHYPNVAAVDKANGAISANDGLNSSYASPHFTNMNTNTNINNTNHSGIASHLKSDATGTNRCAFVRSRYIPSNAVDNNKRNNPNLNNNTIASNTSSSPYYTGTALGGVLGIPPPVLMAGGNNMFLLQQGAGDHGHHGHTNNNNNNNNNNNHNIIEERGGGGGGRVSSGRGPRRGGRGGAV